MKSQDAANFPRTGYSGPNHLDGMLPAGFHACLASMTLQLVRIRSSQNLPSKLAGDHGQQFCQGDPPLVTGPIAGRTSGGEEGLGKGEVQQMIRFPSRLLAFTELADKALTKNGSSSTAEHVGFDSHVDQSGDGTGGVVSVKGA